MKNNGDEQLIKRNRKFPGLKVLLNPDLFKNVLQKVDPDTEWGEVRTQHISFGQGGKCLVSYNVETPEATLQMYAKAYGGPGSKQELKNANDKAVSARGKGQKAYVLQDPAISIHHFPDDSILGTLQKLSKSETRIGLLDDLLAENKHFRQGAIHGLRYMPEQKFVAKVSVKENVHAVLKVYSENDFLPALNGAEAFNSTDQIGIPKRLGACPRRLTQVFECMPGVPLKNILCSPMVNFEHLKKAGQTLATLHAQEVWGLEHSSGEKEVKIMKENARKLAELSPDLLPRLKNLMSTVGRRLIKGPQLIRPCHGNFNARKLLFNSDSDKINILGFDKATFGDPAMDIGLFFAHLDKDVIDQRLSLVDAESCKNIFLEGYKKVLNLPTSTRLETYQALGLISLAIDPFRNRDSSWLEKINIIIKKAEDLFPDENPDLELSGQNNDQPAKIFNNLNSNVPADEMIWSSHTPETIQENLKILCVDIK
ncbi:MAG: aminoglycoside phosphotransferase family protein [Nitrospinales bacterium]